MRHPRSLHLCLLLLVACTPGPAPAPRGTSADATRPATVRPPAAPPVEVPAVDPAPPTFDGPWAAELAAFERQDRERPFAPGGVVLVGSSSIRLWDTLEHDLAPLPVLNRGFGGSRLQDAIDHAQLLVRRHRPALAVVFSGTNDLAGEHPLTASEVHARFEHLVRELRLDDPERHVVWIAITPTLAREAHLDVVREANRLVRTSCEADPDLTFVDPTADLADAGGRPDARFFQPDRLHLNAAGYAVWTRQLRPVLLERYRAASTPGPAEPPR